MPNNHGLASSRQKAETTQPIPQNRPVHQFQTLNSPWPHPHIDFLQTDGESFEIQQLRLIEGRPVAVNGTITKYRFQRASGHGGNFDKIDFVFKVNGRSVRGTANGVGAEGSPVTITYYAQDPSIHCVGEPSAHIKMRKEKDSIFNLVRAVLAFAFAGPLLAAGLKGNPKVM